MSPEMGDQAVPAVGFCCPAEMGATGFALHIPLKISTSRYLLMLFYSKAKHCGLEMVGLV